MVSSGNRTLNGSIDVVQIILAVLLGVYPSVHSSLRTFSGDMYSRQMETVWKSPGGLTGESQNFMAVFLPNILGQSCGQSWLSVLESGAVLAAVLHGALWLLAASAQLPVCRKESSFPPERDCENKQANF